MAELPVGGLTFFPNNIMSETEGFPPQADQHRHWTLARPAGNSHPVTRNPFNTELATRTTSLD